jgi:hypothetical protein
MHVSKNLMWREIYCFLENILDLNWAIDTHASTWCVSSGHAPCIVPNTWHFYCRISSWCLLFIWEFAIYMKDNAIPKSFVFLSDFFMRCLLFIWEFANKHDVSYLHESLQYTWRTALFQKNQNERQLKSVVRGGWIKTTALSTRKLQDRLKNRPWNSFCRGGWIKTTASRRCHLRDRLT